MVRPSLSDFILYSQAKPEAKKKHTLPTQFDCLFCDNIKSVEVKMNRRDGTAEIRCRICAVNAQYAISDLSAPVDVYAEWVDQAEQAAKDALEAQSEDLKTRRYRYAEREDEDDEPIGEDEAEEADSEEERRLAAEEED